MFQVLLGVLILQSVLPKVSPGDESKIDPKLTTLLKKNEKFNVVISFKTGIRSTLARAAAVRHADRGTHNTHIITELEKNADSSQDGLLQMLNARSAERNKGFKYFKQYKTTNSMFVREATADFVRLVSKDSQVSKITPEPVVRWVTKNAIQASENETSNVTTTTPPYEKFWHIGRIKAREAWEVIGSKGEGVVIGILDTGVFMQHESLRDNFRGEYGWFDPVGNKSEPWEYDRRTAHGTHVAGIAVGTTGAGVAPGAKWMACGAGYNLEYEHLRDCILWFQCPTLPDGSARDCSKAPHVINNSWESVRNEPGYWDDLFVWRELGIIPVFAAGNDGGGCKTATSPGEYPFLISVGNARRKGDFHHYSSAVGPSTFGPIKPDLSATGEDIRSGTLRPTKYTYNTGTSMASPVVAGVVALLKASDPDMTYEEVYEILTQNTDDMQAINLTNTTPTQYCKNVSWQFRPNNFFGFGRLNALKAVQAQTEILKLKGKLSK